EVVRVVVALQPDAGAVAVANDVAVEVTLRAADEQHAGPVAQVAAAVHADADEVAADVGKAAAVHPDAGAGGTADDMAIGRLQAADHDARCVVHPDGRIAEGVLQHHDGHAGAEDVAADLRRARATDVDAVPGEAVQ